MKNPQRVLLPLAATALAMLMSPGVAQAADTTYQTTLDPLNHATGSGTFTMTVHGNQATIDESFSGLAPSFNGAPYPHVQHIHIGSQGVCPTPSADKNGDGVVSTTEGQPAYGPIGTTLSVKGDTSPAAGTNIKIAPAGASEDYHRTITLSAKTMHALQAGTGVIVVHGLDPTTLSKKAQKEKSDLVPQLPLAATSPALCGALSSMPTGGVGTGDGSTAGVEDLGLFAAGGALLAAGAAYGLRRRHPSRTG